MSVPIEQKYGLSIEEAAEYFNVGINRLRNLVKENPRSEWVIWAGTKAIIKRRLFEKYMDTANTI